jgi:cytochrome c1
MKERSMRATRPRLPVLVAVALSAVLAAAACNSSTTRTAGPRIVKGASPDTGKQLIVRYGCGSCHEIPGVKGARGLVGPPLTHFGRRGTIAGQLANTPDNLTRWIDDPQAVEPGTDMPNLGISTQEARNIAAYLESLD